MNILLKLETNQCQEPIDKIAVIDLEKKRIDGKNGKFKRLINLKEIIKVKKEQIEKKSCQSIENKNRLIYKN